MKKISLKQCFSILEQVGGPNFYGEPTFGGTGNFGFGGEKQLAGFLNPATRKIEQQRQDELDQNIRDQEWTLGKYRLGSAYSAIDKPVPHWNGQNYSIETVAEQTVAYDNAASRMRDLPGFPPMNSLVDFENHVPMFDNPKEFDLTTGKKAEYFIEECELDDELNDMLGDLSFEEDSENEKASELILRQYIKEILNDPKVTYPSRVGINNIQMNSLAWQRNHINPEDPPVSTWHLMFTEPDQNEPHAELSPADKSIIGGMGAIAFPKDFVPKDFNDVEANERQNLKSYK